MDWEEYKRRRRGLDKYTPGPWLADERNAIVWSKTVKPPIGTVIADVWSDNMEADVLLLAASPDLYQVAVDARLVEDVYISEIQRLCGPDAELSGEAQGLLNQLRIRREKAIKKVEGN